MLVEFLPFGQSLLGRQGRHGHRKFLNNTSISPLDANSSRGIRVTIAVSGGYCLVSTHPTILLILDEMLLEPANVLDDLVLGQIPLVDHA